jgi:putative ABC transport system permease protein
MKKLLTNKLILCALCIVIGIAPLVTFINTLESGKHMLREEFGRDSILVSLNIEDSSATYEDFEKLSETMPEISAIIPISKSNTVLNSYKGGSTVALKAVDNNYLKYAGLKIIKGQFINKGHLDNNLNVIVIDDLTADKLFGTTDVLGRKVETNISGMSFESTIIGICKRSDITETQSKQGQGFAYVPITMLDNNLAEYNLQQVILSISGQQIEEAKSKIIYFLLDRDVVIEPENIKMINQVDLIGTFVAENKNLLWVIAVLWLVSAIVGIANIMLVDIEQNKKYYGLLKFYGSTRLNIRNKVIGKAYAAALVCSIFSIVIGITASFIICNILNIPIYISIHSLTLGILLPIAVCLVASIYPSHRASSIEVNNIIWQLD